MLVRPVHPQRQVIEMRCLLLLLSSFVLTVAIDWQLADEIHLNQVEDGIKIGSRMDSSIRSEAYSKQMVRYEQCHELKALEKTLQKLTILLPLGFAFNQLSSLFNAPCTAGSVTSNSITTVTSVALTTITSTTNVLTVITTTITDFNINATRVGMELKITQIT